ncbi:pilus assembly protein TadG-related protein [Streptomyces sp. NPDC006512]|uniref:pilus assembly protein TadG-related protein n=1 Tax=Streptomyces sp. NPDC006512 TaxID=3154307 RepID=UPI0033AFFB62
MERRRREADRGQAFPIYVVIVAGLLFAAFALFVVGQASVTRSDAQGAADAAALAAARDARDHLTPGLVLADLQPREWSAVLDGKHFFAGGACAEATEFAARNGAVAKCVPSVLSFQVTVETDRTVGDSVIPETGGMRGTADATAVIEARCHLGQAPPATEAPSPTAGPSSPSPGQPSATPGPPERPALIKIECKGGKELTFDPSKPDPWRTLARNLFDVRLTD